MVSPRLFLIMFLALSLAGCGGAAVTAARFVPPETPGGRLCVSECGQSRQFCRQSCELEQRGCMQAMQTQAIRDYEAYVREQYASRLALELRPRDFERPKKCVPESCYDSCGRRHQSCYENCGGKVEVDSGCQFLCF